MARNPTCMLLTLGDELLMGIRENSHLQYLGEQLTHAGVTVLGNLVIRDNETAIVEALKYCWERADCVITTGGLGPTVDDITRESVAKALNVGLERDDALEQAIMEWLQPLQRSVPSNTQRQCYKLQGATTFVNAHGTAPGQWLQKEGKHIILLPGPPNELYPMWEEQFFPVLREALKLPGHAHYLQLRTLGVPEAVVAQSLEAISNQHPTLQLAYCAHNSIVDVRLSLSDGYDAKKLQAIGKECEALLGDAFFTYGDTSLTSLIVERLLDQQSTLSVAESCTGGLLSHTLTAVTGVSAVFKGSVVSYQNEIKTDLLDVSRDILKNSGAVSEACAQTMVTGIKTRFNTTYSLSVTGYAGPSGGTQQDPVGTVYIGIVSPKTTHVKRFNFSGNRETIKRRAVQSALKLLWEELK